MKSGLEGRNNRAVRHHRSRPDAVSMKSGLEGRNNLGVLLGLSKADYKASQ